MTGGGLLRPVTFPAACRGSNPSQAEDQGAENSAVRTRPMHPRALLNLDLVFCRSVSSSRSLCPSRDRGDTGGVASRRKRGRLAERGGQWEGGAGSRRACAAGLNRRSAVEASGRVGRPWRGLRGERGHRGRAGRTGRAGPGRFRRPPPCAGRAPGPPGPVLGRAPGPRCVGERVGCRARPLPAGAVGVLRGLNPSRAGLRRPPDLPFALQELRGSDTELPREWPAGAVGQVSPPPGSGVGVAAGGTAGL